MSQELLTLRRRGTTEREAAEARAQALRASVPALAAALRALGGRRVVLFGSLATGPVHARSDIDLAVEGLPADRYWEALAQLGALAPAPVDLVRLEDASPALRDAIARGEAVPRA